MKNFIKILILFLLFSCAKKEILVDPEVVNDFVIDNESGRIDKAQIDLAFRPVVEDSIIIKEVIEDISNDSIVDSPQETNFNIIEPQASIIKELDYDELFPDSIWTSYMTKRGDYLSLIAYKEYNNANEWRRIYNWNRDEWEEKGIGPDRDNPNFIYPYKDLDLKKPAENAIEWAYDYYVYIVKEGESLWTIAQSEYDDELAWVVLFWDNEKILEGQEGKLIPGMELKVRTQLWPDINQN